MSRRLRRLVPSPAMVVALVALFVALGGVSYGVASGYIDSREIKNNSIQSKDVRNGTLTGTDSLAGYEAALDQAQRYELNLPMQDGGG